MKALGMTKTTNVVTMKGALRVFVRRWKRRIDDQIIRKRFPD